ncbi:unnamed protein product [Urochloa humidicola]
MPFYVFSPFSIFSTCIWHLNGHLYPSIYCISRTTSLAPIRAFFLTAAGHTGFGGRRRAYRLWWPPPSKPGRCLALVAGCEQLPIVDAQDVGRGQAVHGHLQTFGRRNHAVDGRFAVQDAGGASRWPAGGEFRRPAAGTFRPVVGAARASGRWSIASSAMVGLGGFDGG